MRVSIPFYLREALSTHIPGADFAPYFAFIDSLLPSPLVKGHRHHILPRREFPEYVKVTENIICVSPADHFKAHYYLALCAPKCESFQVAFYLMANYKTAAQILVDELPQYTEIYVRGREKQIAIARVQGHIHGLINGRKNVENGHITVCVPKPTLLLEDASAVSKWLQEVKYRL